MELRCSPGLPVEYPIAYFGFNLDGVETHSNLSTGRCKFGNYTPVDTRTYFELRIYLTGAPEFPMKVDLAAVRWAMKRTFGLELIRMQPEEQVRLPRFLSTLETGPGC